MATTLNLSNIVAGATSIALANANTYDFINLVVKKANAVVLTKRKDASTTQNIVVDADSVDVTLTAGEVALLEGTNYELYAYTEEDKRPVLRLVGTITKSASTPEPAGEVGRSNLYKYTGTTLPVVDSESDFTEVGDIVYHNGDVKVRTTTAFEGITSGGGKPIQLHKANGDIIGYENDYVLEEGTGTPISHGLKDALSASVSGDSVHLRRGVYDIGNFIATGKTGIYINCEPGCEINGSNTGGTISDGGVEAVFSILGFPTITNSNGLDKRIVLSNVNSKVNDFWWEYDATFEYSSSSETSLVKQRKNTIGGAITIARKTVPYPQNSFIVSIAGIDDGQFGGGYNYTQRYDMVERSNTALLNISAVQQDLNTLGFEFYGSDGNPILPSAGTKIQLAFKLYP